MDTKEKRDIPVDEENNVAEPVSEDVPQSEPVVPEDSAKHTKSHKEKKDKKIKVSEAEFVALQAKAQKLDELQDTFVRRVADFENAKKRLVREKEDFAKFANERLIGAFLPVLDNLDRALHHGGNTETVDGVLSGVQLIKKQIVDILESNGLEKIESTGKPFDPHFHEAMGTVESAEHQDDSVFEEIQAGYMLKDKLLRPSWVRVAKNPNDEAVSEVTSENIAPDDSSSEDAAADTDTN